MKVFLIATLALSLAINVYQFTFSPKATNLVIANSSQAECISKLRTPSIETNIIGPNFLSEHKALDLNLNSNSTFNKEASGCYFDSYIENVTVDNLAEKVHLLRSTGSNSVTFFKDASSNEFTIYGQSK